MSLALIKIFKQTVSVCVCVLDTAASSDLLLSDPGPGILETPPRVFPASSRAPSGAAPPLQSSVDGSVDALQLVPAHLHPVHSQGGP